MSNYLINFTKNHASIDGKIGNLLNVRILKIKVGFSLKNIYPQFLEKKEKLLRYFFLVPLSRRGKRSKNCWLGSLGH